MRCLSSHVLQEGGSISFHAAVPRVAGRRVPCRRHMAWASTYGEHHSCVLRQAATPFGWREGGGGQSKHMSMLTGRLPDLTLRMMALILSKV